MQYSFTCPLDSCNEKMTVEAQTKEEAAQKLTGQAKAHLAEKHPDIKKTDEQVHEDITSKMQPEEMTA